MLQQQVYPAEQRETHKLNIFFPLLYDGEPGNLHGKYAILHANAVFEKN
jgi:hypothetical protein